MQVWRSLDEVPDDLARTVVTVGNYDGVHLGHQHVISRAREVADELGGLRVVVVTFDPHPIAVLRPEHAPPTLTIDRDPRGPARGDAGADDVLVLPFTREVAAGARSGSSSTSSSTRCTPRRSWSGVNFRFGAKAAGDVAAR